MFFGLLKSWVNLTKDEVVSCPPNCPAHQNGFLHEERNLELILETLKVLEGIQARVNLNVQPGPALYSKGACEEQMCLGFFNITLTKDATVILQRHVLSL